MFLQVSVCDLDMAEGEHLVKQLSLKYGKDKILFCQCDVTDYPQFEGISSLKQKSPALNTVLNTNIFIVSGQSPSKPQLQRLEDLTLL